MAEKLIMSEGRRTVINRPTLRLALPVGMVDFIKDCVKESGLNTPVFYKTLFNNVKALKDFHYGSTRKAILSGVQFCAGAPEGKNHVDTHSLHFHFINIDADLYNKLDYIAAVYHCDKYEILSYMVVIWIYTYKLSEYVNYRCRNKTIENFLGDNYAEWLKDQRAVISEYFAVFELRGRLDDEDLVVVNASVMITQKPDYLKRPIEECLPVIEELEKVDCKISVASYKKFRIDIPRGMFRRIAIIALRIGVPVADLVSVICFESGVSGKNKFNEGKSYFYIPVNDHICIQEVDLNGKIEKQRDIF